MASSIVETNLSSIPLGGPRMTASSTQKQLLAALALVSARARVPQWCTGCAG